MNNNLFNVINSISDYCEWYELAGYDFYAVNYSRLVRMLSLK